MGNVIAQKHCLCSTFIAGITVLRSLIAINVRKHLSIRTITIALTFSFVKHAMNIIEQLKCRRHVYRYGRVCGGVKYFGNFLLTCYTTVLLPLAFMTDNYAKRLH